MLTGKQIRDARKLLKWGRIKFSRNVVLPPASIEAFESGDGAAWLTDEQEACIRRVCAEAGIRFDIDAEGQPGAVMAKAVP